MMYAPSCSKMPLIFFLAVTKCLSGDAFTSAISRLSFLPWMELGLGLGNTRDMTLEVETQEETEKETQERKTRERERKKERNRERERLK